MLRRGWYSNVAAMGAFNPLSVSGLVAWYDFSDVSTLYQDNTFSTPCASDGDPIGGARNKANSGTYDITQGTTAKKPTYKVNIQNSKSAASFDGGDNLNNLVQIISSGDFHYFAVFSSTSIASTRMIVNGTAAGGTHGVSTSSSKAAGLVDATTTFLGSTTLSNSTVYLEDLGYQNARNPKSILTVNNTQEATQNTSASYGGNRTYVGSNTTETAFLTGYIMEILVYSATLASDDITNLRTYINSKWTIY